MLGLFARRPRPDAEAVARLKAWVASRMDLGAEDHVAVAELACHEAGCLALETLVTVTLADRRRVVLRFASSAAQVTEAQVQALRVQAGPG